MLNFNFIILDHEDDTQVPFGKSSGTTAMAHMIPHNNIKKWTSLDSSILQQLRQFVNSKCGRVSFSLQQNFSKTEECLNIVKLYLSFLGSTDVWSRDSMSTLSHSYWSSNLGQKSQLLWTSISSSGKTDIIVEHTSQYSSEE